VILGTYLNIWLHLVKIKYESSITAQVGESNFSALDIPKYVKICLVVYSDNV
jgi:hypothetical protein